MREFDTLKTKKEISDLFKEGKRVKSQSLQIVYKKKEIEITSLLYCTDKSVKKAHDRNRVKRVLRSICFPSEDVPKFYNIAFIANLQFTLLSFDERVLRVQTLLKKIQK